jgi:hypothetical protein
MRALDHERFVRVRHQSVIKPWSKVMENYSAGGGHAMSLSNQTTAVPQSGISRLQEMLATAAGRVSAVAQQLSQIGNSIHGPRPEEAPSGGQIKGSSDSLRSRVETLHDEISYLEKMAAQLVR